MNFYRRKGRQNHTRQVYDGHKFDSGAEVSRYIELKAMQAAGEIAELWVHPKYVLLPKYVDRTGRVCREVKFIPDFGYIVRATGVYTVEDVKGVTTYRTKKLGIRRTRLLVTPDYLLKKAMFIRLHPAIEFREVGK